MLNDTLREIPLESEELYNGAIVHLQKLTVELPNGKRATREVIRHVGAAAIVPVDEQGRVALVRQYRAPMGRVLLELPAGKRDDKQEDYLVTAKRELAEETGLVAGQWTHLSDLITTPGFTDEVIALYLARDLQRGTASPDEDEFLHVVWLPFEEVLRRVRKGEIGDAKTVAAILLAQPLL